MSEGLRISARLRSRELYIGAQSVPALFAFVGAGTSARKTYHSMTNSPDHSTTTNPVFVLNLYMWGREMYSLVFHIQTVIFCLVQVAP